MLSTANPSLCFLCCDFCYFGKTGGIRNSQLSQNFTVESDIGHFQAVDKFTVGQVVHVRGSIDPRDPQSSEITLSYPAISEGVHECLVYGIGGSAKKLTASTAKAFGQFKYFFTAMSRLESSFNPHGVIPPKNIVLSIFLLVGQQQPHFLHVGLFNQLTLPQGTFTFGRLFGQDMASV
jgi:hypothetical protein